jgi:peptide/nickel transport system ATP-binding protein
MGRETTKAVDGVDLDLFRGHTVALVGESGCGKSTTGRAILRLVTASGGQIHFDGTDVMRLRGQRLRDTRRHMQMVFQDPLGSFDRRMTVAESLEEPLIIHRVGSSADRSRRIRKLLEQVQLDVKLAGRLPRELSGGQRQRVAIARALALEPKLLVLDEPLSALDVSVQAQVMNLLLDLQRDLGLAFLLISHDLRMVQQVASRICVMYLGKIVEEGTARDLYESARHPYTKALLSAIPDPAKPHGQRILLQGELPSPSNPPPGCTFHTRCPYVQPTKCRTDEPQLEAAADGRVSCHWHREIASGVIKPVQPQLDLGGLRSIADRVADRPRQPRGAMGGHR